MVGLLMELVPGMKRVGVVSNAYNPNVAEQLRETENAVGKMSLRSHIVEADAAEEYDRAFVNLSADRVDCVVVLATFRLSSTRKGSQSSRGQPASRPPLCAARTSRRAG